MPGDLLLTGTAWPTVGSLPKPVCASYGQWPGWPAAPVSDESAVEVACAIQIDGLTFFYLLPAKEKSPRPHLSVGRQNEY